MEYANQLQWQKAFYEDDFSVQFTAHESKSSGKWLGSYKVLKGSRVLIEVSVANTFDTEKAAATKAHDLGVEAMEKYIAENPA